MPRPASSSRPDCAQIGPRFGAARTYSVTSHLLIALTAQRSATNGSCETGRRMRSWPARRIGSARRRNSLAVGSATAEPPGRARPAGPRCAPLARRTPAAPSSQSPGSFLHQPFGQHDLNDPRHRLNPVAGHFSARIRAAPPRRQRPTRRRSRSRARCPARLPLGRGRLQHRSPESKARQRGR